jgi:VCBS repeat-containing protein
LSAIAVQVVIDGEEHEMHLVDGYLSNGTYEYRTYFHEPELDHSYYFVCADRFGAMATFPLRNPDGDIIPVSGPVVSRFNNYPVAAPDSMKVPRQGTVTVLNSGYQSLLANDSDADGDALTVVSPAALETEHGYVAIAEDGSFSYTHKEGDNSLSDSFTYTVSDGHGGTDSAQVEITITPPEGDHPPVLTSPAFSPSTGTAHDPVTFAINYRDEDGQEPELRYVIVDGVPYEMDLVSGNTSQGTYALSRRLTAGQHYYSFYFTDTDGNPCSYPSEGSFVGPYVTPQSSRYCVAPDGDDDGPGSPEEPFATIGGPCQSPWNRSRSLWS